MGQSYPAAGYVRAWMSWSDAVVRVESTANRSRDDAIEELRAALNDGAIKSRCVTTQGPIQPTQWAPPLVLIDGRGPLLSGSGWADPYRDIELRREDIERLWPQCGMPIYSTGLPGKPSSWHLIEAECRQRWQAGERYPRRGIESPAEWSRVLSAWLSSQHPQAPRATEKTLRNRLSPLLRQLTRATST